VNEGGGGETTYVLGTEERRRLELLEECLDPITARSLDAIGVAPGWRCLELGGGGGSVTRSLCARVGSSGRVTAVDLDTRFLDEIAADNLDVDRRDLLADGIPGGGYDLVHARMLLIHLPTREKFLEEMAAALRPGGWMLVEEVDVFPIDTLAEGVYGETLSAFIDAFQAAGAATTFGRELPALFDRAGLEAVEPLCTVPVYRGGSPWAAVNTASITQIRPLMLAAGATEALLDEMGRLMEDRTQWLHHFAIYSVRGRAPER
jgi:2-polyprenyl-3-methyl-5-hydroxy-6-metoxy-1,4-benzoquinol methylase